MLFIFCEAYFSAMFVDHLRNGNDVRVCIEHGNTQQTVGGSPQHTIHLVLEARVLTSEKQQGKHNIDSMRDEASGQLWVFARPLRK